MTTKRPAVSTPFPRKLAITLRRRVRPHMLAVLQTAAAALAAWYAALLLLPTDQPTFASIAAVICLGIAHGQRRRRAVELITGVLIGIAIASVLISVMGTGPLQISLLVIIAMSAALLFRGGELLVNEAAISAILLASLDATTSGFSADRFLEGLIGGAVALVVASFLLPPDPVAMVGPVAQTLFGRLGRTLEETAAALEHSDVARADASLAAARSMDELVEGLEEVLAVAGETARFSPARRGGLDVLRRYDETMPQLDFAVRNTRVLARYVARRVRLGEPAPRLAGAVRELASAVWVLAALYERPDQDEGLRGVALEAARLAEGIHDSEPSLLTTQIVGQIRSVAVDLVRAADSLAAAPEAPAYDTPTEELLAASPA
jgi:uncharacterized membrane protein YgaE (UPF0421/DUF939 family)